jgi:hypothetical protein
MPRRLATSAALVLMVAALSVSLLQCGSIQPPPPSPAQQAEQIEPMLAAAGFMMHPADTPEKQTHLDSLLPLQVQYYVGKTGNLHYYMADPYYCKCMYIGNEQAYQKYEQMKLNEQFQTTEGEISRQNLEAQQLEEMDFQEEMFNPYGMGLVGPMGPSIYW